MKPLEALRFLQTLPRVPHLQRGEATDLIRGINYRRNARNPFYVFQLHYTADPKKDPTRGGAEWYATKTGDMGGAQSSGWQKEYEIDWRAQAGAKVFEFFTEERNVCEVRELPSWYHRWMIWDYGHRNPTAAIVIATNEDGIHEQELEYYRRGASIELSCYLAHKMVYDRYRDFIGADAGRIVFNDDALTIENRHLLEAFEGQFFEGIIGDPSMNEVREADTLTVLQRFAEYGWYIGKARSRAVTGLTTVNEWWKDGLARIQRCCPDSVREVKYLVWAEHSDPNTNYKEREKDQDNHTTDCWKMFANQFPTEADRPKPNLTRNIHEEDLEIRDLIEEMRYNEQSGGSLFPSLGEGW